MLSAVTGAWALAFTLLALAMLTGAVMEPIAVRLRLSLEGDKKMRTLEATGKGLFVLIVVLPLWNFLWSAALAGQIPPLVSVSEFAPETAAWYTRIAPAPPPNDAVKIK